MMKRLFLAALLAFGIPDVARADNDFFDSNDYTPLSDHTLARASSLNSIFSAIEVGFDRVQTGSAEFFTATSTSVVEIATGAQSFTIGSGKAYVEGSLVIISSDANNDNFMFGTVTSYNGTTLAVDVEVIGGSGTLNDWVISMCGLRGLTGASGPGSGDMLASNNLSDLANAATARTNLGVPSIAGDTFTGNVGLLSTDAGAGDGPTITLDRDSATPATNDELGQLTFTGEDSAGNDQIYGFVDSILIDSTSGSEDGDVRIVAPIAGSATATLTVGNGVKVGNPSGGHCGAGCLNVDTDVKIDNVSVIHGIAQFVETETSTYTTAGTILPFDNTIPQNTEGDQIFTLAITPKNASSTLKIEAQVSASESGVANYEWACALFVDSTAGAIYAQPGGNVHTTNSVEIMTMRHTLSAGSTSARTYKLRCGSSSATDLKINGDGAAALFGGVMNSWLQITEILPQ